MITRDKLIQALGEGLFLLIKYSLLILVIIYTLNYINNTRQMAESSVSAINEYIKNGYLPSFPLTPKSK